MKFFYLVPEHDLAKILPGKNQNESSQFESVLNSNNLPPNKTLQLYNELNRLHKDPVINDNKEQTIGDNNTNNDPTSTGNNDLEKTQLSTSINESSSNKKIIPLYVNTLPKRYREIGRELVNTLLSEGHISINDSGDITSKYNDQSSINLEEFLRCVFVKNASLKQCNAFFKDIGKYIDDDVIVNSKLSDLKESTEPSFQESFSNRGTGAGVRVWCILSRR